MVDLTNGSKKALASDNAVHCINLGNLGMMALNLEFYIDGQS